MTEIQYQVQNPAITTIWGPEPRESVIPEYIWKQTIKMTKFRHWLLLKCCTECHGCWWLNSGREIRGKWTTTRWRLAGVLPPWGRRDWLVPSLCLSHCKVISGIYIWLTFFCLYTTSWKMFSYHRKSRKNAPKAKILQAILWNWTWWWCIMLRVFPLKPGELITYLFCCDILYLKTLKK